jgi:hypothetical protein
MHTGTIILREGEPMLNGIGGATMSLGDEVDDAPMEEEIDGFILPTQMDELQQG